MCFAGEKWLKSLSFQKIVVTLHRFFGKTFINQLIFNDL